MVIFLRKQLMNMINYSKLIGLDSGNYTEVKPSGPKNYIGIRSKQVSVWTGYLLKEYTRNSLGPEQVIGIVRLSD